MYIFVQVRLFIFIVAVIVAYLNLLYPPPSAKFNKTGSFDVLLTIYLSIISVINQLHAQILVL